MKGGYVGKLLFVDLTKGTFEEKALFENIAVVLDAIQRAKPASAKGQFIKSIYMATTMSPGLRLNFTTN